MSLHTVTERNVTEATNRAGWRQWVALAVLMLPVLLVSIDNTVVNFALPQISLDFGSSGTLLLWIVDAYSLVLAGLLVTMGSMADRFGRRRMLLIGATGFAAMSVVAAFSVSGAMLVSARIGLGFFGAMLMPSTLSLLRNIFVDRQQRRFALAIWAATFSVGAALGPVVAGALLQYFHWGAVFLIAVPILVPMVMLTPIFVPESKDPNPGPLVWLDVVLSIATLAPAIYAIKAIASNGFGAEVLIAVSVALVAGFWFGYRQLHRKNPLLDLSLFRYPPFVGSVLANLLSIFSLVGFLYFASQHLQLVLDLDPLTAGLMMVPGSVAMVIAGLSVVPLARRVPVNRIVSVSLFLSALGYCAVAIAGRGAGAWLIAGIFTVLAIGAGAAETLTNDVIVSSVPAEKSGAASAISETAYEVGAVLGTAVLGSILMAFYRTEVRLPAGLSAAQAQRASETLGGAVSVATELPGAEAAALLTSAHAAFDSGVVVSAGIAVVIMSVAAVIALRSLRQAE